MHRTILIAIALALISTPQAEARLFGRAFRSAPRVKFGGGVWRPLKIARFAPQ
jgi:hypothetical protein